MYEVVITRSAKKDLDKLPKKNRIKAVETIEALSKEPRPHGCIKLVGSSNGWRIRIGDYRILYRIEGSIRIVRIGRILHRKESYR
ncbi:MAG: type II toxin-antitoxin system RelE/ParE family toxin [Bacteroidota bacterium]